MTEFIHTLFHPLPNAITTVLMAVLMLYWIFVFLLGLGFDDLDLGFDFDVDVDAAPEIGDADADLADGETDANGDQVSDKSPMMKFLNFVNVGKVPFMLILTTFKFFTWIGSLALTRVVDVSSWNAWSLLILIPLAIVAIFVTKIITNPMAKFFKEIGYKGEEEIDFLGRSGKMLSNIREDKIGTAEFVVDKNPIRLNVKSANGEEIKYGDYVVIEDESNDKKIFLVSKELSLRNI